MKQVWPSATAVIAATLLLCGITVQSANAATPEQVDKAIKKAIDYIYSQEQNGNWEVVEKREPGAAAHLVKGWQWGGPTSIAVCALLYAKEPEDNPKLKAAIDWMVKAEVYGVYALGFRCQVWSMIPNYEGVKKVAKEDRDFLVKAWHKKPGDESFGFFPYAYYNKAMPSEKHYDHSVSQYGVLAMWALQQMNMEVPPDFWQKSETAWKGHQLPSGGWGYKFKADAKHPEWEKESLPMTAAGVATLFLTQDYVHSMEGLDCRGNVVNPNLERGLKWMSENFVHFRDKRTYYGLYGVERIGVASGYKYFGQVDWYHDGADYLVKRQNADGSWGTPTENTNDKKIPDTCFALMFLVRGRAPVLMNKLDYAVEQGADKAKRGTWNERPRDVANISRWVGKQMERDLNWQVVNLNAKVDDLHDAPILWISGREALTFTEPQVAKLKQFVEQGGMILGHADCGNPDFTNSFKKLGQTMFPYEFRELPEAHPIYSNEQFRRAGWKQAPSVLGLSNGARELMLLIPLADPAKGYQTQSFQGPERQPLAELMADIFLYSVDKKNLRNKGETYIVNADPKKKAKATIKVARIEYGGNWDPEPGGWRRLAAVMHNTRATDLEVASIKLGSGKLDSSFTAAHLTGTTKFHFTDSEAAELRKFVEAGGTLIVDAAGGATEFAAAAEKEIPLIFAEARTMFPLKREHAVYSSGEKIADLEYRAFAKKVLGKTKGAQVRTADVNGKTRIFLSQEDLSLGLVGQPVDGVYGYEPKSATALMTNILLYAAQK